MSAVSVVIPNYNDAVDLRLALDAILAQTEQPMEIIVVDDGSTDGSLDLLRQYASKEPIVRFIAHETNQGVLAAQRTGLVHARGEYVYLASANDMILPEFLRSAMTLLRANPMAGLAVTGGYTEDLSTGRREAFPQRLSDHPRYIPPEELRRATRNRGEAFGGAVSVVRKRDLELAGGLRAEAGHVADLFAFQVVSYRTGVCVCPEPLAIFRINDPSSFSSVTVADHARRLRVLQGIQQALMEAQYNDVRDAIRRSGMWSADAGYTSLALRTGRSRELLAPIHYRRALLGPIRRWVARRAPDNVRRLARWLRHRK